MQIDNLRERLARTSPTILAPTPDTRHASVAVVVRPNLDVLLIKRAERAGDPWSGHMAFPGGRAEPDDPDLIATAAREAREEVGIDLGGAALVGRLTDAISPARLKPPRLLISAFVFATDDPAPRLSPNEEVDRIYWLNLRRFLAGEGRTTMPYTWQGQPLTLPAVYLEDAHIWGLTLRFLDDLVERLR